MMALQKLCKHVGPPHCGISPATRHSHGPSRGFSILFMYESMCRTL